MIKLRPALGLFLACILFLSASCSGGAPVSQSNPLKIEWTLWQGDYTLLVANQMGFFKKHGVAVEPVRYDSSTGAIPDLAGAKLDGGLFTMSDIMLASNLADIKAIMVSDNGGRYSVVVSPDIQSVNELRGKRIGFSLHTSSEIFVSRMLKSKLMNLSDVSYIEMSPDLVSQNIPGKIDAGIVWEPYTSQAIQKGFKVIYQNEDDSALLPKLVVFRKAIVDQRPNDIHAFILAWEDAVNYRISHPQESLAIISKATNLPTKDIALTSETRIFTISDNLSLFASTAGSTRSSIYFIAGVNRDFLITSGDITNPPKVVSLLDPSFLK